MGGFSGPPGADAVTGPGARWLQLGETPPDLLTPAVWLIHDQAPQATALADAASPTSEDLADAALFSSAARGAGRLRRRQYLRALAGRCLECPPQALTIVRSSEGALSITAPRPLRVSHSAQAGWTMIGLCERPLGVDLEPDLPIPAPLDVLTPAEAEAVAALEPEARSLAFLRRWTVKEAVLKALGRGLLDDPAGLEARFDGETAEVFGEGRLVALAESRRTQGLVLAVAALA